MSDPISIPSWFVNEPKPCPCGEEPRDSMVLVVLDNGESIMLHRECLEKMQK